MEWCLYLCPLFDSLFCFLQPSDVQSRSKQLGGGPDKTEQAQYPPYHSRYGPRV